MKNWQVRDLSANPPYNDEDRGAMIIDVRGATRIRIALLDPSPYMTQAECVANAKLIVAAVNSLEAK